MLEACTTFTIHLRNPFMFVGKEWIMDKRKRNLMHLEPVSELAGAELSLPHVFHIREPRASRAAEPIDEGQLLRVLDAAIAAERRTGEAIERLSAAFREVRELAGSAFAPAAAADAG